MNMLGHLHLQLFDLVHLVPLQSFLDISFNLMHICGSEGGKLEVDDIWPNWDWELI